MKNSSAAGNPWCSSAWGYINPKSVYLHMTLLCVSVCLKPTPPSLYKDDVSPGLMRDTGCLGLVHWDDPERWCGEGGGRGGSGLGTHVHPWWIHVEEWQNQYNIVK